MNSVLSPTEWREKLISFSQDEFNSPDKVKRCDEPAVIVMHTEYDEKVDEKECQEKARKLKAQYDRRMIQMRPLFEGLPQFEKICKNQYNDFVDSCYKQYTFEVEDEDEDENIDEDEYNEFIDVDESHEKVIDLKYMINLCGYNLTLLDVEDYPFSEIMPLIKSNCPNVEDLFLGFKEIKSQDFDNVFSNMSHLQSLSIKWGCEYSNLPDTLVESLEQVGGTLEDFRLDCCSKNNDFCLPHSLTSVLLGFVVLKKLFVWGFEPTQPLLESIGQLQNLVDLSFSYCWKEYQMLENKINMYPIGNLKNLDWLDIDFDCGITDEFLINLSNNAKKLKYFIMPNTHITDVGRNALNNLKELGTYLSEPY